MSRISGLLLVSVGVLVTGFAGSSALARTPVDPLANPPMPAFAGQTRAPAPAVRSDFFRVQTLLSDIQWSRAIVALPDGNVIVAEGKGRVRVIYPDGRVSQPVAGLPPIRTLLDPAMASLNSVLRGLNDFALDRDFARNRRVFLTYNAPPPGEPGGPVTGEEERRIEAAGQLLLVRKVATATLSRDDLRLENLKEIADLPGRRLVSAPGDLLYVTTASAGNSHQGYASDAQKLDQPGGKVLRIGVDGSIPKDNPFVGVAGARPEIFSLGHRDPDGAFVNPHTGELWMIEHGPMGGDELNIIRAGHNYGWPVNTYGRNYDGSLIGPSSGGKGMTQPIYYWYPSIAPTSLILYTGSMFPEWRGDLFLGALSHKQGKFLVRLRVSGERVVEEEHLLADRGRRVRAVTQAADGSLYVLTDQEDGAIGEVWRIVRK